MSKSDQKKKLVAVGMSGGVDSTIAAYLLKEQGFDVVGVTMSIWDNSIDIPDIGRSGCYGPGEAKDLEFATEVAKKLGIRHMVIDLSTEYKNTVLKYFCSEYVCGKTPNPCVVCNQKVKFGFLMEKARALGIDYENFATGHYVRTGYDETTKRYLLKKGLDHSKDQSYFLSYLNQEQLARLIFPLGERTKEEIKALARKLGFTEVADRDESQDFIETDDYSVLFDKGDIREGDFVDTSGRKLGRHKGIIHYTVGQRKGLGISGGNSGILYVIRIDAKTNTVVVGPEKELYSSELTAVNVNWISIPGLSGPMNVKAKIRQQHKEAEAVISPVDTGSNTNDSTVHVSFKEPQRAVTPGQTVVFYDGETVVGGGVIERS